MKKIFLLSFLCVCALASFSQKETFDLVSYSPPAGWSRDATETITSFTIMNKKNNGWCRINIVKSTVSKGNIEQDFESEWQNLIVKNYNPAETPQLSEIQDADGWKIKTGVAKFTFSNKDASAMLTTMSGFERCLSIVVTTNSQDYIKDIEVFLASVNLIKPEVVPQQTAAAIEDKNPLIGSWGKSNTVSQINNRFGNYSYNKQQYTFNANGSYSFTAKTYNEQYSETLLIKEKGNFVIAGNTITITPKSSVIEAWSKKNGADNWNQLKSTQKRPLETATYQFSIADNNLLLQTAKQTERDGRFNHGTTYTYGPPGTFTPIKLPGSEQTVSEETQTEPVQQTASTNNTTLLGTWCISASDQSNYRVKNGVVSTIFRQYTFKANGTYNCNIKTFDPLLNSILLGRENGTYQISGNNLTINPQKSVLEEWSKINGGDKWGSLLKTQNITPEKITYQFSKQYISEINEWQLLLKANKETKRDGPFNNYERNAWIYIITSPAHPVIKLPGE